MVNFIIGVTTMVLVGGMVWALGYGTAWVLQKASEKFADMHEIEGEDDE